MPRTKHQFKTEPKGNKINDIFSIALAEVKVPEINQSQVRSSQNEWVNYGVNNLFPDFLMKSVKKSTNHSAFIALRENMIKGAGLTYSDNLKDFLENLDEEGNTIEELLEDVATDLSTLETFAVAVRYSNDGKSIAALDYIDSSKVRCAKIVQTPQEIAEGVLPTIPGYFVCNDWQYWQQNTPIYYNKFNPFPKDKSGKVKKVTDTTQLYFYYKRANGQPYIPEISYASCLNFVEAEYLTGKYVMNSLLNGFNPSAMIEISGSMTDEQKAETKRLIKENFQGADAAGSVMVIGTETPGSIKVNPISTTDNTPMLIAIKELTLAAISTAHRCQPILAGIQSTAGLSSDGDLLNSSQFAFNNNVIIHLQKPFLNFMKKVFRYNGITDYQLSIQSLNLAPEAEPNNWEMDNIKSEVIAPKYGYKPEDLISNTDSITPDDIPTA